MEGSPSIQSLLSLWEAGEPSDERLDALCRDHPALASELRSQIEALRRTDGTLNKATANEFKPTIPGYELRRTLGEGGMGTVWDAIQLTTNRPVALKLLPLHHLGSPRAQARFEREVELASRLDHPHIARLYDARLERGIYFFSMERIAGRPIDQHPFPSTEVALQTLILTAHALAHAHGRGILHRDLKPTNLLVSDDHQPHLLDFGLARDITADSTLTLEVPFAGTPGYCAPEQARGEPADVRGDLFSLGLIAVKVLTGRHPFDLSLPPQTLVRLMATQPPRLPAADVRLPADLIEVLRKSIAFDPADRYTSAAAFAADLQAVLDHRPVQARRPSPLYLTARFIRRHRKAVAATSLLLATAAIAGSYVTHRIVTERNRAARSATVASEANRFLTDLLTAANPEVQQGRNLTLRDLLDTASTRITETQLDPEVEAYLRHAIGRTLFHIAQPSDYPIAVDHIRRSVDLRTRQLGAFHPDTIEARTSLGRLLVIRKDTEDEGLAILRELAEYRMRSFGPNVPETQHSLYSYGVALLNHERYDELESFLDQYLPLVDRAPNLSSNARMQWHWMRAAVDANKGNYETMLRYTEASLNSARERFGELHTRTAQAYLNYGITLGRLERHEEAHAALTSAVELRTQIFGFDHVDTCYARIQLAIAQFHLGHIEQARDMLLAVANLDTGVARYNEIARKYLSELPFPARAEAAP